MFIVSIVSKICCLGTKMFPEVPVQGSTIQLPLIYDIISLSKNISLNITLINVVKLLYFG